MQNRCKENACGQGECLVIQSPPYYRCACKHPYRGPNCSTGKCWQPVLGFLGPGLCLGSLHPTGGQSDVVDVLITSMVAIITRAF